MLNFCLFYFHATYWANFDEFCADIDGTPETDIGEKAKRAKVHPQPHAFYCTPQELNLYLYYVVVV